MNTTAQRIISALQQLEQFMPGHHSVSPDYAENVLTGARVAPVPDPSDEGEGFLSVTFPGGHAMKVNGRLYLHLQIIESARFEVDGDYGNMTVSQRVAELSEHLRGKYELN
jgi:hypothetical protein